MEEIDMTDIPEWAWLRAAELTTAARPNNVLGVGVESLANSYIADAFAKYIAHHEQPPVDPLLIEARALAAEKSTVHKSEFIDGCHDDQWLVSTLLIGLRRGMELAKSP